jgi:hypothetical protein
MEQSELQAIEGRLTALLAGWAGASVALGTALAVGGRRSGRGQLARFGLQTLAWGAVDGVIAGAGALSRRGRGALTEDQVNRKARNLRLLLAANAAADVVYIAAGTAIWLRGRKGETTLRMGAGDGLAIVVQGGFLLVLDAVHAAEIGGASWQELSQRD